MTPAITERSAEPGTRRRQRSLARHTADPDRIQVIVGSTAPPARRRRTARGRRPRSRPVGMAIGLLGVAAVTLLAAVIVQRPDGAEPAPVSTPDPTPVSSSGSGVSAQDSLVVTSPVRWDGDALTFEAKVLAPAGERGATAGARLNGLDIPASVVLAGSAAAPQRTAVLLVDTSGSMGPRGAQAAGRAALAYTRAVGAGVKVGLVAFSDRPVVLTAPTTDRATLAAGIAELSSSGETALYDGLIQAIRLAGPNGNVVLLSDGGDTVSAADLDQAVEAASAAEVRVDAVVLETAESDRRPLERITAGQGGRVTTAENAVELGEAFAEAAEAVPIDLELRVAVPPDLDATGGARTGSLSATVTLGRSVFAADVEVPPRSMATYQTPANIPAAGLPAPVAFGTIAFVALALLVMLVAWPRTATDSERRQLALQAYESGAGAATGGAEAAAGAVSLGVLQVSHRLVAARGHEGAIALRLDRAGISLLPHEWVVVRGCILLGVAALGFMVVSPRGLGLLVGLPAGWLGSELWLRRRQGRRCRAFADQLPDMLQVVASSLRSGFSLPQALAAAQEGVGEPIASQLGRALAAARIGVELEDELERIGVRMRSEDWRMVVMAIRIQRSVGGSLAEVLAGTATTLRERAAVARQVQALSAEGRLSAYVLLGLPVGVGLFLLAFRRSYVEPLWTTLPGLLMLAAAVVGMVVGTWWMLRVARVEI